MYVLNGTGKLGDDFVEPLPQLGGAATAGAEPEFVSSLVPCLVSANAGLRGLALGIRAHGHETPARRTPDFSLGWLTTLD
jgi:hypothetical protein